VFPENEAVLLHHHFHLNPLCPFDLLRPFGACKQKGCLTLIL
jgi:hypothetical protein